MNKKIQILLILMFFLCLVLYIILYNKNIENVNKIKHVDKIVNKLKIDTTKTQFLQYETDTNVNNAYYELMNFFYKKEFNYNLNLKIKPINLLNFVLYNFNTSLDSNDLTKILGKDFIIKKYNLNDIIIRLELEKIIQFKLYTFQKVDDSNFSINTNIFLNKVAISKNNNIIVFEISKNNYLPSYKNVIYQGFYVIIKKTKKKWKIEKVKDTWVS